MVRFSILRQAQFWGSKQNCRVKTVPEAEALECQAAESFSLDISSLADRYRSGAISPTQVIRRLWDGLVASRDLAIWIHLLNFDELHAQAQAIERRSEAREILPLYGVPFAVKDNIDVAGFPTTRRLPRLSLHGRAVGKRRRPADRRRGDLCRQNEHGPVFHRLGRRSKSVWRADAMRLIRAEFREVRVPVRPWRWPADWSASPLAAIRQVRGSVPAGCNNIVGLKPTFGALSNDGMVPACQSLDCVAIFATTAADAWTVFQVAGQGAASTASLCNSHSVGSDGATEAMPLRFAVPRPEQLEFFGDQAQQDAFQQSIERLESLGGIQVPIDFQPLRDVASMLYKGPWLAERLASLGNFLRNHWNDVWPVTREVLEAGSQYSAVDYFRASHRLESLRPLCRCDFQAGRYARRADDADRADDGRSAKRFGALERAFRALHEFRQSAWSIGDCAAGRFHARWDSAQHYADRPGGKRARIVPLRDALAAGDQSCRLAQRAIFCRRRKFAASAIAHSAQPRPCAGSCARGGGRRASCAANRCTTIYCAGRRVRALLPVGRRNIASWLSWI